MIQIEKDSSRIIIQDFLFEVNISRLPIKRIVNDEVKVEAGLYTDDHDLF